MLLIGLFNLIELTNMKQFWEMVKFSKMKKGGQSYGKLYNSKEIDENKIKLSRYCNILKNNLGKLKVRLPNIHKCYVIVPGLLHFIVSGPILSDKMSSNSIARYNQRDLHIINCRFAQFTLDTIHTAIFIQNYTDELNSKFLKKVMLDKNLKFCLAIIR